MCSTIYQLEIILPCREEKSRGKKKLSQVVYHRYSKDHVLLGVHLVLEKSATRQN